LHVELSSVALSHYRLSKIKEQSLALTKDGDEGLRPTTELGSGKAREKEEAWLSEIIERLNELFITDGLTDQDMLSYAYTIRDKVGENARAMEHIANNSPDQAMLGDLPAAVDDAVMESGKAHQNLMMQYLNSRDIQGRMQRLVLDLLLAQQAENAGAPADPR